MKDKAAIAIGFYKYLLEEKICKYNHVDTVYSRDKFENNITHTDLYRLRQQKLISQDVYNLLFGEINKSS